MDDDALYQGILMDHFRAPRHHRAIDPSEPIQHTALNPACGDRITLTAQHNPANDTWDHWAFDAQGCAICIASASMMLDSLPAPATSATLLQYLQSIVVFMTDASHQHPPPLGDTAALASVKRFPMRTKCATLPWSAAISLITKPTPP
jgi:nitrogen fixation protein NifU and related proteins